MILKKWSIFISPLSKGRLKGVPAGRRKNVCIINPYNPLWLRGYKLRHSFSTRHQTGIFSKFAKVQYVDIKVAKEMSVIN